MQVAEVQLRDVELVEAEITVKVQFTVAVPEKITSTNHEVAEEGAVEGPS
jgi:hypothetical protein